MDECRRVRSDFDEQGIHNWMALNEPSRFFWTDVSSVKWKNGLPWARKREINELTTTPLNSLVKQKPSNMAAAMRLQTHVRHVTRKKEKRFELQPRAMYNYGETGEKQMTSRVSRYR